MPDSLGDRESVVLLSKLELMLDVLSQRFAEQKQYTQAGFDAIRAELANAQQDSDDSVKSVRGDLESLKTVVLSGDDPILSRVKNLELAQRTGVRVLGAVATALVTLMVTVSGALIMSSLHLVK